MSLELSLLAEKAVSLNAGMLNQTMHKQKGNNQKYMCQNAFFPCLQGIRMRRSKREEQNKDV